MGDEIFEVFGELFDLRKKRKRRFEDRRDDDYDARYGDPRPATAPAAPPIFCVKCGLRNDAKSRYCESCGELLPAPGQEMSCIKCNSPLPLTAKFCPRCGTTVAPTSSGQIG